MPTIPLFTEHTHTTAYTPLHLPPAPPHSSPTLEAQEEKTSLAQPSSTSADDGYLLIPFLLKPFILPPPAPPKLTDQPLFQDLFHPLPASSKPRHKRSQSLPPQLTL